MTAITSSKLRKNLAQTLTRVRENREAVVIEHGDHGSVVMIPLEEYESMNETEYLLRNPANASRLLESVAQLKAGRGKVREIDLEA
ncbi:MAG: type II toxin-antitoxin system prevent-host-death family antitoxin [Verrucomicrobiaceae bacterium]|nr:type II toxin-antitoxin system prevent-host-death family antitoxin [Verrucomicrobiaceae bacterium]